MDDGIRMVEGKYKAAIYEPWKAGEHDPPMQDWLRLPVSHGCPNDPEHGWGTVNPVGYFPVRRCNAGCDLRWRAEVTTNTIRDGIEALCGTPKRLGRA